MKSCFEKMTVYFIQHTHTDIGYTKSQAEVEMDHAEYIRDVVNYNRTNSQKCKWVCEGLWTVEQFLSRATPFEIQNFLEEIKEGNIGISGSYFNMTEMIADQVMEDLLVSAHKQMEKYGIKTCCAMTADVNGYSASYPRLMNNIGVKYLLSLINDVHGGVPYKRQTPFIWKGPDESRLVCWIGEHYNQGNFLGMDIPLGKSVEDALSLAEEKLPEYINDLRSNGYPYDFCPITISGVFTDNSPPCFEMGAFADLWNQKHGDKIEIRYCLLEEFFDRVKTVEDTLPVVSGDWTDWWSDGIGSTPDAVRIFRQAQRNYLLTKMLDPNNESVSYEKQIQTAKALAMFAEHTWGYYRSVSHPWEYSVSRMELQKCSYAATADFLAQQNYICALKKQGDYSKTYGVYNSFVAINPYGETVEDVVALDIPYKRDYVPPKAVRCGENLYPVQWDGEKLWSAVKIEPHQVINCQGLRDGEIHSEMTFEGDEIITPFYKIRIDKNAGGIVSIIDIKSQREIVTGETPAFLPVYEVTYGENGEVYFLRSNMFRGRNCQKTKRYYGRLTDVTLEEKGSVYMKVKFTYSLEGCSLAFVEYKFYNHIPVVDLDFTVHKESKWEPENLYLTLPFESEERTAHIDKGDEIIQPGIDGLPNSCASFFSLQNGIVWKDKDFGIGLAMPDSPLIRRGPLEQSEPLRCLGKEEKTQPLFAWVMNNFWETNFKATLGGFHQFRFRLTSGENLGQVDKGFEKLKALSMGLPAFMTKG